MKLISHRGNTSQIIPEKENKQNYIDKAIDNGYDVEIDIRCVNKKLYLGHDTPDYETNLQWLLDRRENLWIHTKNFAALSYLIDHDLKTFYHQKENHTIINNTNLIWSHHLSDANEKSIIPLLSMDDINYWSVKKVYGICSDFVEVLRNQ